MSELSLKGRSVIVAGGAGGIGEEVVRLLATERKVRVVIADANEDSANALAETIEALGGDAIATGVDLTSQESVDKLMTFAHDRCGDVFGLVNTVGVVKTGSALDCPEEEYRRQFEVNVLGAIRLNRAFVQLVRAQLPTDVDVENTVHGSLVYISSIAAKLAIPNRDPYCVSKAAGHLHHLSLANEVAMYGINVNVVAPGRTETPSAAGRIASAPSDALQMFSTQRRRALIPAYTIAETCVFLLGPALVGYSGQEVVIAEGADTTYRPSYEALTRL